MSRWTDRICVILLNWNGKEDTIECLNSLSKCTYPKFTPIVVDNGSQDDSVEAIRQAHPSVPIFETNENLGFAGGNNIGIKWALSKTFDWIFLLNNDTIVAPDIFEKLLETAYKIPEAKIFGAKLLRYSEPNRIDHLGGAWCKEKAEFLSFSSGDLDTNNQSPTPVDYVCGAGLFMHKSVPLAIGLLEPNFFLFWEETDFCFRARRKGFLVYTCPEGKVWHKISSSFTGGKPHSQYFWWRSRLLWLSRNLAYEERKQIYRKIIFPELLKTARHLVLKSVQRLFNPTSIPLKIKTKRLKASLFGAFDFFRGKFGNCPSWLLNN